MGLVSRERREAASEKNHRAPDDSRTRRRGVRFRHLFLGSREQIEQNQILFDGSNSLASACCGGARAYLHAGRKSSAHTEHAAFRRAATRPRGSHPDCNRSAQQCITCNLRHAHYRLRSPRARCPGPRRDSLISAESGSCVVRHARRFLLRQRRHSNRRKR